MCKENSRAKYEVAIAWFLKTIKKTVVNVFPFVFFINCYVPKRYPKRQYVVVVIDINTHQFHHKI